jgi:hypothetical protein
MTLNTAHTFHIPVMGIGYTIDTPAKVAHYGISSVISLVDDILAEKMREFHCRKRNKPFESISDKIEDFRAKRFTAYLNLMDEIVTEKFEDLKQSIHDRGTELEKFFQMLPDQAELKQKFQDITEEYDAKKAWEWVKDHISPGKIDVNIMTKLDKENYKNKEQLPIHFSDAHAALRGFANSDLNSSVVLSAGMNPRLYSYMAELPDFFPDESEVLKKRITLKVSDYRSAMIQGKFLAKKGLWVSEYRIESGLNCGGHAFATDGYLMGPILQEFKDKRQKLQQANHAIYTKALAKGGYPVPEEPYEMKITAQGGVGTAEEHAFLSDQYGCDSVGWGTPFLLVPEAVNVDENTLQMLREAVEEDLYLSGISPLGVPFNSLRANTKDIEKQQNIEKGRPGSPCPKKYVSVDKEFTDHSICRASRQYQYLKLQQLEEKDLDPVQRQKEYEEIVDKSCICVGLGTAALLVNDLDTRVEGEGVSVCPGPNMAYFSEISTLQTMTDHIYGRDNVISRDDRPHMFIKELSLYVDYLRESFEETPDQPDEKQLAYLESFRQNLYEGIEYYKTLFSGLEDTFLSVKEESLEALDAYRTELENMFLTMEVA